MESNISSFRAVHLLKSKRRETALIFLPEEQERKHDLQRKGYKQKQGFNTDEMNQGL